jgi:hypothetical protein
MGTTLAGGSGVGELALVGITKGARGHAAAALN